MKNGCYLFKTGGEILVLPLEIMIISRMRFIIKDRKEYNFYKFYGLDININEPKLEEDVSNYLSRDITYLPRNIHPALEDCNKTILNGYPSLFERISKIQVLYIEKSLEEITKKDSKEYRDLFF